MHYVIIDILTNISKLSNYAWLVLDLLFISSRNTPKITFNEMEIKFK